MSYWDIATMSRDGDLESRCAAAAAQEGQAQAWAWAAEHMLALAASPGWAAAWASAVAVNNPAPGKDPAVITDGMILSAVQALAAP